MNADKYIQKLIDENNSYPPFENIEHMVRNVMTVCGLSEKDAAVAVFFRQFDIESSGLTAEKMPR